VDIEYNPIYKPYWDRQSFLLLMYGGAGSGKSYFAAQRYINKMLMPERRRIIFCRKTSKSVRNSQFLLLKDMIVNYGVSSLFTINETRMEIKCTKTGNELLSAGLDDVDKLKSFTNPTDIWVEEATEIKESDYEQLETRLRAVDNPEMVLTFNPISKKHWIYNRFFKKEYPDTTILRTTYKDNKFLNAADHERMENKINTNPAYYRVYTLGEWGTALEGVIFQYQICDDIPEGDVCYGLDFGYNVPTALVRVTKKENSIYAEECLYKAEMTNTQLIEWMHNRVYKLGCTLYPPIIPFQ